MRRVRAAILRVHVGLLALVIPDLAKRLRIARLLALFTPRGPTALYAGFTTDEIVRVVERRLRRPWRMRRRPCLRRGLLLFYFLRLAGEPAVLHFCVYRETIVNSSFGHEQAHCWVTIAGRCIASPPENEHVVILVHGEGRPHGHRAAA
jgi:hypothetical protein